ncbi:MAG: VWA domain-containing protein [Bryobacterales bacterium]|nr:VWA domain-containing protein [Bryobacterales bacterium]
MHRWTMLVSLLNAAAIAAGLVAPAAAVAEQAGPLLMENVRRKPTEDHGPAIKVDVSLVLVPVTVTDDMGRIVSGLHQNNFAIYDDKQQQPIISFASEDAAFSVGLVFDTSGSMRGKMDKARLAARAFWQAANPEDEVFLVTFSDRAELQEDFTSDIADIQSRLLFAAPKGKTALIDAVDLAMRHLKSARNTRKALLVISDGGDNNSRLSKSELLRYAKEADVQIYGIGIHHGSSSPEEMSGPLLLEDLARATGGQHFIVRSENELPDIAARIGVALHDQYMIGYQPPYGALPGKWRQIRVRLQAPKGVPTLRVYARTGYYAPER